MADAAAAVVVADAEADPRYLSAAEAAQYDRQLRLWGVEVQRAMSSTSVLVAGLATGAGAEAAKNLVLAGVAVTVADARPAEGRHLAANFLVTRGDVGLNLASASLPALKALNPLVSPNAVPTSATALTDADLRGFCCAVLCDLAPAETVALADRLHALGVPVFAASSFGFTAFLFCDLGASHKFVTALPPSKGGGDVLAEVAFPSLGVALRSSWMGLRPRPTPPAVFAWLALHLGATEPASGGTEGPGAALSATSSSSPAPSTFVASAEAEGAAAAAAAARHCAAHGLDATAFPASSAECASLAARRGNALAPVSAVIGGMLGQEVIKLISRRDAPIRNLLCFDLMERIGGAVVFVG